MLWIQTPTTWLRGPFHDVRETVNGNKTKQGNERKHQLRTTPNAQVMGEKYICLEVVLPQTFTYMVLIMRWNPSLGRVSLAARLPGICCHGPACSLPLLAWWAEKEPREGERGRKDHTQRVRSGIHPTLAQVPTQKALSGKIRTECHDFHSSWRSAELGGSQHEFPSSLGSE